MATFLLARTSRLCRRVSRALFVRQGSFSVSFPLCTSERGNAYHCSNAESFKSEWKRHAIFLDERRLSISGTVGDLACTEDQEDIVDKIKDEVSVGKIKDEISTDKINDEISDNIKDEVSADKMKDDISVDNIKDVISAEKIKDEVSTDEIKDEVRADKIKDEIEIKDEASVDKIKDKISVDNEAAFMAIKVAHKLGIISYKNLCSLEAVVNCTEDELFKNLSFLMSIGITEKQLADTISLQPSLMAMDLAEGLNPVVKCMESLGLDESVLAQALMVEPELAPLFAEKALQCRIRALQDLDFSNHDIAMFLKMLQCKQLAQFLRLPVEKIEPALAYITDDIGVKSGDAIKLVKSSPSVLLRDVEQEFKSKMKILNSIFNESRKARKVFVHVPELLGRKTEALEETVACLKSMVEDAKELRELVEASPVVLTHRRSGIEQVSKYLQSLGFNSSRAATLIAREPYLVSCGTERLKKHVEFLRSKNLDEQAIYSLMESSTGMFFRSLEKRVAPKIEFLENQGITGESLQKFIKSRPQVYQKSLRNTMAPNLEFLLSLGFEKNSPSLKGALKVTLPHSCKSMQSRIDYLLSLGIEIANVHKIVRETPSVLVMTDSTVKKRVEFLVKVMKRPVQELVKCPSFLISNIDNTIKPRLRVLEWLRSQGLRKSLPLSTLVETTEAAFVKQFVEPYPEVSSIYKGTRQQS